MFINENQLEQLDFLLDQSIQGVHHLFDQRLITRTMQEDGFNSFNNTEVRSVQSLLNKLISQPTISLKRAYISRLREDEKRLLLRSYFNIVENTIYDTQSEYH